MHIRIYPWLSIAILLQPGALTAEPIPVRYPEGTTHGFLALRTLEGKLLAAGDLTEVLHGDEVISHLVFHFKDGSVDDDTTVFSQRGIFRLISDHHIQKGPSFPHPTNMLIKAATGQVTVRYRDKDREKEETDHLDLPPDLANGILHKGNESVLCVGCSQATACASLDHARWRRNIFSCGCSAQSNSFQGEG